MKHSQILGNYLGPPSSIGKKKTSLFAFVDERTRIRVHGWKSKLLNQARKEVLIKSVVTTTPSYVMSCFLILKKPKMILIKIKENFGGVVMIQIRKLIESVERN